MRVAGAAKGRLAAAAAKVRQAEKVEVS